LQLWLHLKLYVEKEYQSLRIYDWVEIENKYIFITNSLLKELNRMANQRNTIIEVINIDIDTDTKIPTLHLHSNKSIDEELLNRWYFLFFAASFKQ